VKREWRIQRGRADCEIGNTISMLCKHTLPSDHPCRDGRQTRSAPPRMAHSRSLLSFITYQIVSTISVHGTYGLIGCVLTCVPCLTSSRDTDTPSAVDFRVQTFLAAAHRLLLASVLQLHYNSTILVQLQSFVPMIRVVTACLSVLPRLWLSVRRAHE